jgi:hypothetical protein
MTRTSRILSVRKTALCAAAALLALAGCDERIAGTSVGTGNPTEIQLGFKDGTGSTALSGRVSVYASTQIPVEGYRPDPLLDYEVHDAASATLKAADFAALPESAWAKGSVAKEIHSFNVVVTGASQGSVLAGFGFDKAKGRFVLRPEDDGAVWDAEGGRALLKDSLRSLVNLQGLLDTTNTSRIADYHLFLYGTGFSSKIESGGFLLRGIPEDKYAAFLISIPHKDHQISGMDSTEVFSTSGSLSVETTTLSRGDVYGRVRLPDSLIVP